MDFVDLHIHTTASDGSMSPSRIVEMALEKGLYAIAITDHDTVDGVAEAVDAARGTPLKVIPGVEISANYNGRDVHVLGLNLDWENPFLVSALKQVEDMRRSRNEGICSLLREHGINITAEECYARTGNNCLTRGSIARLMIEKGYVETIQEAFEKYLSSSAPCYVPRFKMPLDDTYKLISYCGGICSLAHPVQYKMSDDEYRTLFLTLKQKGFSCIEAIHSDNGPFDQEKFTRLANECGLKITGGSDFHGASKPDVQIGTGRANIMVPKEILANIGIKY